MYADDEFKAKVIEIAREAMHENGWCRDGVNEALANLDLKLPPERKRALIRFEVEVFFDLNGEDEPDAAGLEAQIDSPSFDNMFGWSSGYSNIEVTDVSTYVEELDDSDDD